MSRKNALSDVCFWLHGPCFYTVVFILSSCYHNKIIYVLEKKKTDTAFLSSFLFRNGLLKNNFFLVFCIQFKKRYHNNDTKWTGIYCIQTRAVLVWDLCLFSSTWRTIHCRHFFKPLLKAFVIPFI